MSDYSMISSNRDTTDKKEFRKQWFHDMEQKANGNSN